MALKENIEFQIEEIINQINANNMAKDTIEKLEVLVKTLLENVDEIDRFEITEYVDEVYKDKVDINKESIKDELNVLKTIAGIKRQTGSNILDFDKNQIEFIKKFCLDATSFINLSRKKVSETIKINDYKNILRKMENREKLSVDDLPIIIEMLKEKGEEDLKANLMDFYKYNLEVDKLSKVDVFGEAELKPEILEEKILTEEEINENIDRIVEVVKSYVAKDKEINVTVGQHKVEIATTIDFENSVEVLETLKELNIYHKFNVDSIFVLMLYGSKDSIKQAYEEFSKEDNIMYGKSVIYKFPSLWVKQEVYDRNPRKRNDYKNGHHPGATRSLKSIAILMNRIELYEKMEFYNDKGYDVLNFTDIESCLSPTLETIKAKYKDFELYGLQPNLSSFRLVGNVKKECDRTIECGLLMPVPEDNNEYSSYCNNNPSFISEQQEGHIIIAETLLGTEKWKEMLKKVTTSDGGEKIQMRHVFRHELLNEDVMYNKKEDKEKFLERIDTYRKSHNMEITNESNLERYKEMELVALNADFDPVLMNSKMDFIEELDEKYKENDYKYQINASIISRLKVIRLYDSLQKYNETLSEENKLAENDIRFFAITYGTYIKKDTYEQIKGEIYERGSKLR